MHEPTKPPQNILEEALDITANDRQRYYGHPSDNHGNTAALWSAYLQRKFGLTVDLDVRDVCLMMVLLKVSRDANKPQRDNLVDICGYTRNIEQAAEREAIKSEVVVDSRDVRAAAPHCMVIVPGSPGFLYTSREWEPVTDKDEIQDLQERGFPAGPDGRFYKRVSAPTPAPNQSWREQAEAAMHLRAEKNRPWSDAEIALPEDALEPLMGPFKNLDHPAPRSG